MATAQRPLSTVQLGKQSDETTEAAATAIFSGLSVARHKEAATNINPDELRGLMAARFNSNTVGIEGQLHLEGYACYDDINYIAAMGMKGGVSGSSDGGTPAAYTRTYAPALTTIDQPDWYTIEAPNNIQNYTYKGCFVRSFQISAAVNEDTMFQADILAISRTAQAKTGSLSLREPRYLPGNSWLLYMDDASGGTIGTTAYAGCLQNFTWRYDAFDPFKCMDGTLYRSLTTEHKLMPTLEITATFDASMVTQIAKLTAQTRQLIRLRCSDPTNIHTSPNTPRRLTLDGSYVLTDVSEIGGSDVNGTETLRLSLESQYDATSALLAKLVTVTSLSALP